jgi:CheY-like chemotaxis protein
MKKSESGNMESKKVDEFSLDVPRRNRDLRNLMPYRVHEILLIASPYDAYMLEEDGIFNEKYFGVFERLQLDSIPRVISVDSAEEALEMIRHQHFDLVITMMRTGNESPFDLAANLRELCPGLPVLLLLNVESDMAVIERSGNRGAIEDVFLWNGDHALLMAMIKYIEDKRNLEYDIQCGMVKTILLVEDSIHFYSRYLPLLYTEIMLQTQRLISDELNMFAKKTRMRLRPKVLMVHSYEAAVALVEKYNDNLLCLISDIAYPKNGELDEEAGFHLMEYMQNTTQGVPLLLQSSDIDNYSRAYELGASFLNKNSDRLMADIRTFIINHLGFGDLILRNAKGEEIARARNLDEFEKHLQTIPDESLLYHGIRNHFSAWLMAHGEIQMAEKLRSVSMDDFKSPDMLRRYLHYVFREVQEKKHRGKIVDFRASTLTAPYQVVKLADGSLGGKGRGLAFLNDMIASHDFRKLFPRTEITVPKTFIIGTNEFDRFLQKNHLIEQIISLPTNRKKLLSRWHEYSDVSSIFQRITADDEKIEELFVAGKLSDQLDIKLRILLTKIRNPLAIRSSSLLEDSQMQPFAGVYSTYMVPNNAEDFEERFNQLAERIKLVYASIFMKAAREYIRSANFKIEDEKMAVVIQEVVGQTFGDFYYPHLSGVAQSFNFYPTGNLQNDDGVASLAVGLGKTVVDGGRTYVFSPRYPKMEILSQDKLMAQAQKDLFAISFRDAALRQDEGLVKLKLRHIRDNGSLNHSVSEWDYENDRLVPGIQGNGPLVVTFADILKHDYVPLAKIIGTLLRMGEKSLGVPVELEFAMNLPEHTHTGEEGEFFLLQIRPLNIQFAHSAIDLNALRRDQLLLFSNRAMGNGRFCGLTDIIVFDEAAFDNTQTTAMQQEVSEFNDLMVAQGRHYILIGPGRWGSRDRFLGIPVRWGQICNAKAIIEYGLEDFNVDASQGTHFFHNLISMNVGYFTIPWGSSENFMNLSWVYRQPVINRGTYFMHIRTEQPLMMKIDGKQGVGVIQLEI